MTEALSFKTVELQGAALAVKFADANLGVFEGYASTFGKADKIGDIIAPGAFAASLSNHQRAGTRPAMLWAHDQSEPVGTWSELNEDPAGLRVMGKFTLEVARAREAYALARDGALSLSIGFIAKQVERLKGGAGRLLKQVELVEISLVPLPMNPAAKIIGVKSQVTEIDTAKAFEKFLRDAGFSRAFAVAVTNHGFNAAAGLRDADGAKRALVRELRSVAQLFDSIVKER